MENKVKKDNYVIMVKSEIADKYVLSDHGVFNTIADAEVYALDRNIRTQYKIAKAKLDKGSGQQMHPSLDKNVVHDGFSYNFVS